MGKNVNTSEMFFNRYDEQFWWALSEKKVSQQRCAVQPPH